MLCSVVME